MLAKDAFLGGFGGIYLIMNGDSEPIGNALF
jgi:hypothetical protein